MAGNPKGGGLGLLVDFLEHEVTEAALVRHVVRAAQERGSPLHPRSCLVIELDSEGGEQRHLPVFHRKDRAREASQGRGVTGAEEFPFPQANQQRRCFAGHHQGTRERSPNHRQGVGPMQPRQNRLHSLKQELGRGGVPQGLQAIELLAQQMGNDLGVRVRAEDHTLGLELLTQASVVLDDPVLHHGQTTGTIEVGVGIAFFRLAVGRPTGVANAALPLGPLRLKTSREVGELAFSAQTGQAGLVRHRGDAGGVIAPVFELTQTLQQERCRLARTNHRNDAAHSAWNQ